jgi:hypothetical protein
VGEWLERYLVHENSQGTTAHALVIGVGAYPHLTGGSGPLSPHHDGMRQLSSPPVSARNFATWLISKYHHPRRPLSTVALLVSEDQPQDFVNPKTGECIRPAEATYDHIAEAIWDWMNRGQRSADNLVIFYFCGHGIAQGPDMTLLLSDFGKVPQAPLNSALDFRKFRLGMSRNLPRQQVYFVDACRASSDTLIESFGYAGQAPVHSGPERAAEAPAFYATLAGEDAFGKPNQTSVFTEALLKGLDGAGSDDSEGDWRVTTTRLKEAIDYHVRQAFEAGAKRAQVPPTDELTTFELHYLQGEPEVPVVVTCQPESANAQAEFVCEYGGMERCRRRPDPAQWSLVLQAGNYRFRAEFAAGAPQRIEKQAYVRPVYRKVPLEVQ